MFFSDQFNQRKVNMGDITMKSKEDFLKKIKEEVQKAKYQKKIDDSLLIIGKFLDQNFSQSSEKFKDSKLITNLTFLLDTFKTKAFDKAKMEKLSILSIKKISDELLVILYCRSLPNNYLFNLIHTISEVLSYTNNDEIKKLFTDKENMKYIKIFFKLIKGSIYELYFNLTKDYLINEKFNIFAYIYYLNYVFPSNTKKIIYKTLSHNLSFLYILMKILYKHNLIIGDYNMEIFFDFCGNISNSILKNRNKKNKIVYQFFEEYLNNIITNFFKDNNRDRNEINVINEKNLSNLSINVFDLCLNLDDRISFLQHINSNNFLKFFDYIVDEIKLKIKNNDYLNNVGKFNFYMQLLKKLIELDLNGYDRAIFLQKLSFILQYIFLSFQMRFEHTENDKHILNKEENDQVKKGIEIIYYSAKVLENLYLSNMEKKNNQIIYDYILNKVIIKYCPK